MSGDAYVRLAMMMNSGKAVPSWIIGEVVDVSPIKVEYAEAVFDEEDLLINAQVKDILEVGDSVILFSDRDPEQEHFFLAAKVV